MLQVWAAMFNSGPACAMGSKRTAATITGTDENKEKAIAKTSRFHRPEVIMQKKP